MRSVKRGDEAASKLRAQFPGATIEVWTLEMSSYESIQAFIRPVEAELTRIDIVILNAGIGNLEYGVAKSTGHEEVLQVNVGHLLPIPRSSFSCETFSEYMLTCSFLQYLSAALLSILVLPTLKTKSPPSAPGRLIIVRSGTALGAKFPSRHQIPLLESFDDKTRWDSGEQYSCSKLLGHYFIVKLVNYVNPKDVIVNIVDPGLCKGSSLFGDVSGIMALFFNLVKSGIGRSADLGSSTYVDAAVVKGKDSHGCFIMD